MKKLLLSSLILLALVSCRKADTEIPFDLDCNHTQELRNAYLRDASKIQQGYIYNKELSDTADLHFGTYDVERRLCELIAIKNWSNPLSDTIFNQLDLRAAIGIYDMNCITLTMPSDIPNRDLNQNTTGITEIDNLIRQHNLEVGLVDLREDRVSFQLCSEKFVNTFVLSALFREFESVISTSSLSKKQPEDIVLLTLEEDYVDYFFTKKWSYDNLDYSRKWKIRVYDDYTVRLRETSGDTLP